MSPRPYLMFPAVNVEATPVPLEERDTERPSTDRQSALEAASKASQTWHREPVFAFDPERCTAVLALPYTAVQVDCYGNVFEVGCPAGTELRVPTSVTQAQFARSTLVDVVLHARQDTVLYGEPGREPAPMAVTEDRRRWLVQAFIDGDAGRLPRG